MFLRADLCDNSCQTANHAVQPDKTLSHSAPFTEDVPWITPRWDISLLPHEDRWSFVHSELNETCSWYHLLNIIFKNHQWAKQEKRYLCCTPFPTSYWNIRKDTETEDRLQGRAVHAWKVASWWKIHQMYFSWKMIEGCWGREEELFPHVGLTETLQMRLTAAGELYRLTVCLILLIIVSVYAHFSSISTNVGPFTLKRVPVWILYSLSRIT